MTSLRAIRSFRPHSTCAIGLGQHLLRTAADDARRTARTIGTPTNHACAMLLTIQPGGISAPAAADHGRTTRFGTANSGVPYSHVDAVRDSRPRRMQAPSPA
jgi:hypothetical protein